MPAVDWFDRLRRAVRHDPDPGEEEEHGSGTVERAAPGIAALFTGLKEDGSHTILDLAPAAQPQLRYFGPYSRRMRFAGLLPSPPPGMDWSSALKALPPHPDRPYDLVLGWDVLDRLGGEERALLVERLGQLTGPGARLYFVVDASRQAATPPLRFRLLGLDRVSQEPVGPPEEGGGRLLSGQVEHLLAPFEVVQAFTLRQGFREYVAVKGGERAYARGRMAETVGSG